MDVKSIGVCEKGFRIDLRVTPSAMIVPQVITYEKIIIEIPKSNLTKNIPLKALSDNMDLESYRE